jgi:6,7-dimethyl-8-ribityllumazine synthase
MKGSPEAKGLKGAIVYGGWYPLIGERLLDGAIEEFEKSGGDPKDISLIEVPGSFELPMALQALSKKGGFDFLVALGIVIRGETAHFDYVCTEASRGCSRVMLDSEIPVGFGLLTVENSEQAMVRAGGRKGNKGAEAMSAAIEMANFLKRLL